MASIVDSFNEALTEDFALVKIGLYSIPVYFCTKFFIVGQMNLFYFYGFLTLVLFFGLLTKGINNVRMSKKEILTMNPKELLNATARGLTILVPQLIVFGAIGHYVLKEIQIPVELPHVPTIFAIIVWSILGSIVLTSYLSFAKYLRVVQAFNYLVVFESCVDVFVSFLFFIPQLLLANVVLIGPVAYLFYFFQLPFTHWGFIFYCSLAFVVNISILANYLAQSAYENIKGSNEEYDDNHNKIDFIEDSVERMN